MRETRWRKSRHSEGGGGNCVEVAHTLSAVRDSKNPHGPVLAADVRALITEIRAGRLDR